MADVTPILIKDLAAQTTLQDTDYFIVGGADAKKITVAQMKSALGINGLQEDVNELNTNNIQTVSLENGATGTLTVQKIGKIVYVTGDINLPSTYNTDGPFWLANLPYSPADAVCFFSGFRGVSTVLGSSCRGHITASGVVQVFCPVGSSGGLRFSTMFFTN